MKRAILTSIFALLAIAVTTAQKAEFAIVPRPLEVVAADGNYQLTQKSVINYDDTQLDFVARLFAEKVDKSVGIVLPVKNKLSKSSGISLMIDATKFADEEYSLTIGKRRIAIVGGSPKAVLYGLQSLRQLIVAAPATPKGIMLDAVAIHDKPTLAYRGSMLDVCRHIFTVEQVKTFIDMLSLHKINYFHWHLTEDQGWRIEIKRYPELTRIGSMRDETAIGKYHITKRKDGAPYGGYFTQEQVRDIVKYASDRYITVIPEIEMPGHAVAALASYPYLGCTGGPYKVRTIWGISKEVFCAGKESTFEFLENVLAEVIELFPSKYIHIGGDECPKNAWKVCEACQKRIADEGLADEHQLQSYFMERIEKWLNKHGRHAIGWDEILKGGISKTTTIMAWNSTKIGATAAKLGNNVIMSPKFYCYIDYYQTMEPEKNNEPLANGRKRQLPVSKVYSLNPFEGLTAEESKAVIGVQANLWTEYIPTFGHAQYMALPRLAALSEVGWSHPRKDYADFAKRMETMRKIYEIEEYRYAPYMFQGIE
ncbi:MAG: beta-N-acetylhexosaminidase [Alistipes sp.]|nr:beta-N-acetylhexosaminidase [Alistipes sp.]